MAPEPALWYVMINDAETGPLTRVELGVELATGAITSDSLVWTQGMINWVPGVKVPELQALFRNPPRSPRAAPDRGSRPPPPPPKGTGLSEFDTAHFKLKDVAPEEGGAQRQMEFDTAHFKLADLANESSGARRQMEFDTSHFRLQDLKGVQGARALVPKRIVPRGMEPPPEVEIPRASPGKAGPRSSLKQASTAAARPLGAPPVAVRQVPPPPVAPRPAPKAAPRPAPGTGPVKSDFDPNQTSVDFRTLGELVHQQHVAQSLFESETVPDEAPIVDEPAAPAAHVEELSKWAAAEVESGELQAARPAAPKKKLPPLPAGDLAAQLKAKALAKSARAAGAGWIPVAIGTGVALVVVVVLLRFLLD